MTNNKRIYSSKYTDKQVDAACYLVDMICERWALKSKRALPLQYWNDKDYWAGYFFHQLKEARKLLKSFDIVVVAKAIRQTDATSMKQGHFLQACKRFHREQQQLQKQPKKMEINKVVDSTGDFKKKPTILDEL